MTHSFAHAGCLPCRFATVRGPTPVVAETPAFLAFLDPEPIRRGHLQVVSRAPFAGFNALPDALARDLLNLAERLAAAQRRVFEVDRVGFLFPAEGSGHAAVHLVPLLSAGDVVGRRGSAPDRGGMAAAPAPIDLELARSARLLRRGLLAAESMGVMP